MGLGQNCLDEQRQQTTGTLILLISSNYSYFSRITRNIRNPSFLKRAALSKEVRRGRQIRGCPVIQDLHFYCHPDSPPLPMSLFSNCGAQPLHLPWKCVGPPGLRKVLMQRLKGRLLCSGEPGEVAGGRKIWS